MVILHHATDDRANNLPVLELEAVLLQIILEYSF